MPSTPEQLAASKANQIWLMRYKRSLIVLAVIVLYSLVTGNLPIWRVYKAAPIEGTVIDAVTKKPLSGVVVVANWHLQRTAIHGTTNLGALWLAESVTDQDGHYKIPGQELKLAPAFSWFGYTGPLLYYFKPTYMPLIKNNPQPDAWFSASDKKITRTSVWDGQTIALEKPTDRYIRIWEGPVRARFISVKHFSQDLKRNMLYAENCDWENIPRMITAIDKDLLFLEKSGYKERGVAKPSVFSVKSALTAARIDTGCADPNDILRY